MKINEILSEAISSVVYYYRSLNATEKIIESGEFELSSVLGSIEQEHTPKGYYYYMSTTRTRRGGFHDNPAMMKKPGALFVLDGNWFNKRYKGIPVNYFQNRDPRRLKPWEKHEAEDRIVSRDPTIPIDGVKSLHIFAPYTVNLEKTIKRIILTAEKKGIPAYFYTDSNDWLNLNTKKAGDVDQLEDPDNLDYYKKDDENSSRSDLSPWVELIEIKDRTQLSKEADDIRDDIVNQPYYREQTSSTLGSMLRDARSPNAGSARKDAVKIFQYMKRYRLPSIIDFVNHVGDRWSESSQS